MKLALCIPTIRKPHEATLRGIALSAPLLDAAGIEHVMVAEVGCPYISHARATLLRKALDAKCDTVIFIDHDMGWQGDALLKLAQSEGGIVAGTYRFKRDPEEYMGQLLTDDHGLPILGPNGQLLAHSAPAGFLKVTAEAVDTLMGAYPELCYGPRYAPSLDLFQHGAHDRVWYGEDYALSRRWREAGEKLWILPDLTLVHYNTDGGYIGNFHEFLMRQPGGSKCP